MVVAAPPKMAVEKLFKLQERELNFDLVRGQAMRYPTPGFRHGRVWMNSAFVMESFVRESNSGGHFPGFSVSVARLFEE